MRIAARIKSLIAALAVTLITGPAFVEDSLSDPSGSCVLISAAHWVQGTLLGTIATIVAVTDGSCNY